MVENSKEEGNRNDRRDETRREASIFCEDKDVKKQHTDSCKIEVFIFTCLVPYEVLLILHVTAFCLKYLYSYNCSLLVRKGSNFRYQSLQSTGSTDARFRRFLFSGNSSSNSSKPFFCQVFCRVFVSFERISSRGIFRSFDPHELRFQCWHCNRICYFLSSGLRKIMFFALCSVHCARICRSIGIFNHSLVYEQTVWSKCLASIPPC